MLKRHLMGVRVCINGPRLRQVEEMVVGVLDQDRFVRAYVQNRNLTPQPPKYVETIPCLEPYSVDSDGEHGHWRLVVCHSDKSFLE